MAPPPGQDAALALKAQHRKSTSGSASPRTAGDGTKGPKSGSSAGTTAAAAVAGAGVVKQSPTVVPVNVHYTLLIRLPFARGDFEDPPQVCTGRSGGMDWL